MRFSLIKLLPEPGFNLGSTAGESSVLTARLHMLRQSLLSLHMIKSYVRTATCSTLKVEANLTQILNFKANFHTEFEPF